MKWAVAVFFLSTVVAMAQEPNVPEGATVKLLLLRQKSVQKELNLGADAAKKITDFTNAQAEAAGKALEMPEAARKDAFAKLAAQNEKFIADNLDDKQEKRLDQITIQCTAFTHLLKAEVVKDLKLSDDQVKKCKDLQTEARKGLVDLIKSKEAGKSEKFAKLRTDLRTKLTGLLNDDQKKKVREIAGEPFEGEIVFEDP
jgi:hypothetical protein